VNEPLPLGVGGHDAVGDAEVDLGLPGAAPVRVDRDDADLVRPVTQPDLVDGVQEGVEQKDALGGRGQRRAPLGGVGVQVHHAVAALGNALEADGHLAAHVLPFGRKRDARLLRPRGRGQNQSRNRRGQQPGLRISLHFSAPQSPTKNGQGPTKARRFELTRRALRL
jgi:hypothetical protein